MEPIALTITDTSKAAGFGKTTTYKLIKEGKLTVVKIGRRTLITSTEYQRCPKNIQYVTQF